MRAKSGKDHTGDRQQNNGAEGDASGEAQPAHGSADLSRTTPGQAGVPDEPHGLDDKRASVQPHGQGHVTGDRYVYADGVLSVRDDHAAASSTDGRREMLHDSQSDGDTPPSVARSSPSCASSCGSLSPRAQCRTLHALKP